MEAGVIIRHLSQETRRVAAPWLEGQPVVPLAPTPQPNIHLGLFSPLNTRATQRSPAQVSLRPHPSTLSSREMLSPSGLPQAPWLHCLVSMLVAPGPGLSMDEKENLRDQAALGPGMAPGECSGVDGGCDRGP